MIWGLRSEMRDGEIWRDFGVELIRDLAIKFAVRSLDFEAETEQKTCFAVV